MNGKKQFKMVLKVLNLQKPKAPSSPFLFFSCETRKKLMEENPNLSFQEISSKLSDLWKNLSSEQLEYYEELSAFDKCRFKEEKHSFQIELYKKLVQALRNGTIKPSSINELVLPPQKQAKTAFSYYSKFSQPLFCGRYDKDQAMNKPLNVTWNSLNSIQRFPFEKLAQEESERVSEAELISQEISQLMSM